MASQAQFSPQLAFSSGVIAGGAKAYFYETGTTTPVTVYSDAALTTPHADPLVANSAGEFAQVFYGGGTALKAVIKTSAGTTIATIDPVPLVTSTGSAANAISFSPVAGNSATEVQTAIENLTTTANGLGTMSTQNGNAVAITGGTMDGASVGATTPGAGAFTTLGATGAVTLGATAWASLFLDEDDMASDSATKAPSQQSTKAHVARFKGAPAAVLQDQKASGTDGGTATTATWTTRDLNTEVRDPDSLISIASNQFTPTVNGWVEWISPFRRTDLVRTRLYNVTDTAVAAYGGSARLTAANYDSATLRGGGAVVAGKAYRIEYYVQTTTGTSDLGSASSLDTEIYTTVNFWRD